jgi:hypothetical protein
VTHSADWTFGVPNPRFRDAITQPRGVRVRR